MNRVTGIGGIFFKARDPQALDDGYRKQPGIAVLLCAAERMKEVF